jgi:hypothetical protein
MIGPSWSTHPWSVVVRNHVLVLVALAGLGMTGCGSGTSHHGAASAPADGKAGTGGRPLPTAAPHGDSATGTCTTVSYRITGAGVEVTARVAATPANINVEADDKDDNPVTGDPRTAGADYAFKGRDTQHILVIKGVRSLDHLTVIAVGTGQDDSCRAYPR